MIYVSGIVISVLSVHYVKYSVYAVERKNSLATHAVLPILQDEIFHVPQVQAYCAGNFSHWDPMITTLPGLYSVSWIAITVWREASLPQDY